MPKRPPTDDDKTTPFIRDDEQPAGAQFVPAAGSPATAPTVAAAPKPLNLELGPKVGTRGVVGASFAAAKAGGKMPGWAIPLIGTVVFVHLAFLGASWASSIWQIERLDRPKGGVADIAIAPAPPPPPPPPPGGAKPQTQTITPKKKTVKDIVQPVKIEKQETKQEDVGDPNGEVGGEVGGVAGGVVGGDINGVVGAPPPPPPPPPPPAPPQNVPPTMLEGSRIAGEKMIVPSDVTKTEIQRSGKDKVVGSYKLCITVGGDVNTISQLKSTGFGAYDAKIQSEMRSWRYRPYMVNGKAVPVCTAITFIYSQK
jgi:periplasmic protein TonB